MCVLVSLAKIALGCVHSTFLYTFVLGNTVEPLNLRPI